jgi:hypothetical protein
MEKWFNNLSKKKLNNNKRRLNKCKWVFKNQSDFQIKKMPTKRRANNHIYS